jgi:hypothetical protein
MKKRGIVKAYARISAKALRIRGAKERIAALEKTIANFQAYARGIEQSIEGLLKEARKEKRAIVKEERRELERVALSKPRRIKVE